MCSYLLHLNHIQIRLCYWYRLSLSISDTAIDNAIGNAIRYWYWWRYRYSLVTSAWTSSRNASVLGVSSALLFWRDYKSAKGSKTGKRWLVGLEIRCMITTETDSFTKPVLEYYKDKAKSFTMNQRKPLRKILGLLLLKENCVKETSVSQKQNGTLYLMYQSQRTWGDILKWVVL